MDRKIKPVKVKPKYLPVKCPVCNGFTTVSFDKKLCKVCDGKGVLFVPCEEVLK